MADKTNLELALQAIEKKYGKGSIMKMDGENVQQVEAYITSLPLCQYLF